MIEVMIEVGPDEERAERRQRMVCLLREKEAELDLLEFSVRGLKDRLFLIRMVPNYQYQIDMVSDTYRR